MKRLTRGQAIRAKCIECSGGDRKEVRLCVIPECDLYRFRMGREREKKKKEGSVVAKTDQ